MWLCAAARSRCAQKKGTHTHAGGSFIPFLSSFCFFPFLFLSLWVSISCDHLLSIFPPICLCLLFVLIPFHTALLSLSLLCLRGTHFIFLVHIHILVQLLNFYLLIIAGLSLCAAAFWRMGGTAAPERESVCVCVWERQGDRKRKKERSSQLCFHFGSRCVSCFLSLSLNHSTMWCWSISQALY